MTESPNSKPTPSRARGVHPAAVLTAAVAIVAAAVAAFVFFPPQEPERAEAVTPVFSAHDPGATALAGAHRGALAASAGLRAATVDLAGFTDPAILDDAAVVLASLDRASGNDDAAALIDATALFASVAPALVERLVVDGEARIANSPRADAALLQAASDAAAATRGAAASPNELTGLFVAFRASVEAAEAGHAQAVAAEEAAARSGYSGGGSSSGGSSNGFIGIAQPDADGCDPRLYSPRCNPPRITALGQHVEHCPEGSDPHSRPGPSGMWGAAVTLDYPVPYYYRVDGPFITVYLCEPSTDPGPTPTPYPY
ncbi:hypothetical protein ET445_07605 [Agromyces protaetiae]|uniref:Uncharacterized protein n=1 Tax=Agromyces protaetiae TaxID=2509455 RepID=A0A4P6FE07_9MICO|nr:hypothetical protein [Agromyces protaetiae]QAY73233.1 hypothetical protein ET445_07605 [Agromyces protaetiae]